MKQIDAELPSLLRLLWSFEPAPTVIGGFVRSLLLENAPTSDLDLVVDDRVIEQVLEALVSRGFEYGLNRHGNPRVKLAGSSVDLFAPDSFFGDCRSAREVAEFADNTAGSMLLSRDLGFLADRKALQLLYAGQFGLNARRWNLSTEAERGVILIRAHILSANLDLQNEDAQFCAENWYLIDKAPIEVVARLGDSP